MPAPLRRVLRYLRLALVCLALVWSSAPAAAAPITDAIALVAATAPAPADRASPAHDPAGSSDVTRIPQSDQPAIDPPAARAPGPPRRLYLEHRALLC